MALQAKDARFTQASCNTALSNRRSASGEVESGPVDPAYREQDSAFRGAAEGVHSGADFFVSVGM